MTRLPGGQGTGLARPPGSRPLPRAALALYPPSWRARYGDEVRALLDDSGGGPAAAAAGLAWRALPAWLRPPCQDRQARMRTSLATALLAWSMLAGLGLLFAQLTQFQGLRPPGHPQVRLCYLVLDAALACSALAAAAGGLPLWLLMLRRSWREHRRRDTGYLLLPVLARGLPDRARRHGPAGRRPGRGQPVVVRRGQPVPVGARVRRLPRRCRPRHLPGPGGPGRRRHRGERGARHPGRPGRTIAPGGSAVVTPEAAAAAAAAVAAGLGVCCADPAILHDGANVIVHLRPAPVVAKVAASTTEVRPEVAAWLRRELDVARFLAGRGIPVAEPSPEIPAAVYHHGGQVMSFWRYLPPPGSAHGGASAGEARPGEAIIGSMLRDLHAALRDYPARLPVLAPLADIPAFLARPRTAQTMLTPAAADALAAAHAELTAGLRPGPGQPLHGDAGAGNLMATGADWVWHDFEDACSGPVAWDLAAATASPRLDAAAILAAYREPVDPAQLAACQQLRRLHLTVWYALYAERLPDLRPRAAELLASWPAP